MEKMKTIVGARWLSGMLAGLMILGAGACGSDAGSSSGGKTTGAPSASEGVTIAETTASTGDATDVAGTGTDSMTPGKQTSPHKTPTKADPNPSKTPTATKRVTKATTKATSTPSGGGLKLVENGSAVSTIVIAKKASEKVQTAAADLQDYLKRITGATVKIGFDDVDRTSGNYILVGPSKYTDKLGIKQPTGYPNNEKVILKRVNNYLVLMGNDDGNFIGTQNAVTMFLEDLGCGWFGPDTLWQVVPSQKAVTIDKLDVTHTPKFISRENRVYLQDQEIGERWYLGGAVTTNGGHNLPTLIGKDTYFKTHPEWFSLINGKRDASAEWWQYDYTNEAFAAEVGKKVSEYFDKYPNTYIYSITANDGWNDDWCECDVCAKYPSATDIMITFANRVGAEVAKKHPDKRVSILSYHPTWFAPKSNVKAAANVEVMFCTETSMTSPIENGLYLGDTADRITHNTYRTSWKANFESFIRKAGLKNIAIWKWYCISADNADWQNIPWVQGNVAIRDQNYWKKQGAGYVFYDQGPLAGYHETSASYPLRWPLWYVAAKGMWDAGLTGDQILKEACVKLFGAGADAMLGYYQALANASEQCTAYSITWVPPKPTEMYTRAQVKKIDDAITKAKAMLSKVSADEKKRMENQIGLWQTAKMAMY